MIKYLPILFFCLYSIVFTQNIYPYYSDPNKQMEYEEKKIYIIEIDEKRQYYTYSGGTSYTELANTWGYLLFDEQPSYVVKQIPLKTHINYEHIYDFKIMQGTQELSELEFLLTAGYTDKAKQVYNEYNKQVEAYNLKLQDYENALDAWEKNNTKIDGYEYVRWHTTTSGRIAYISSGLVAITGIPMGVVGLMSNINPKNLKYMPFQVLSLGIGVAALIINNDIWEKTIEQKVLVDSLEKPWKELYIGYESETPTIKQSLTNVQIKSLAEGYNRRLYEEIKNK